MPVWTTITKASKQPDKKISGLVYPPVSHNRLQEAYKTNAYHRRALDTLAINIVGDGFEQDSITAWIDEHTPDDAAMSFLHKTALDFLVYGNAYWEDPEGNGQELYHIPAWTMFRTADGWRQTIESRTAVFTLESVFQFRNYGFDSTVYGSVDYLPILDTIDLVSIITCYNKKFFENNAIPDNAIIVEGGTLSAQAEEDIRTFLRSKVKGYRNAHKTLYIPVPEGAKLRFEKLQYETKDVQFQQLLQNCINEIIACHGVPPRLMGVMTAGQLGGGGETAGQTDIFFRTIVQPKQRLFCSQIDGYFKARGINMPPASLKAFAYENPTPTIAQRVLGL